MIHDFEGVSKIDLIRTLIDNTPIAYIIMDEEYRIYYVNESFLKLRKLNPALTIGERCYNISNVSTKGTPCKRCAVRRVLAGEPRARLTRRDILADGSVRFIDDYAFPLYRDEKTGRRFVMEVMVDRTAEITARETRNQEYQEVLALLLSLIDAKDKYTAAHSQNVHNLSVRLGNTMNLEEDELFELSVAATLHDIGKVRISDEILNKPGKLTDEEFAAIQNHPVFSGEMLEGLGSFSTIRSSVRHHHERVDGRGYPDKLSGEEIPRISRIIAVADTYDAMTSTRSYRKAMGHPAAAEELRRVSGGQLDREVVEAFFALEDGQNSQGKKGEVVERVLSEQTGAPVVPAEKRAAFAAEIDEGKMLEGIFENTPCGYVLMDTDFNVRFASRYFLELMGLEEDEVINRKCYQISEEDGVPCVSCAFGEAVQSGRVTHMRKQRPGKGGPKTLDIHWVPLAGGNGQTSYVIEIVMDRTEEVRLENQRQIDFVKLLDMLEGELSRQYQLNLSENLACQIDAVHQRIQKLTGETPG